MAISSPGIGSNLDVTGIVAKLMAVESQPLATINTKTAAAQAKISALGAVKSALSTFQSTIAGMANPSVLQPLTSSSSDSTVANVILGAGAVAANYSLTVTQLAQSQKLASAGQLSVQSKIGSGTLSFDFGTIAGGAMDANGKYGGANFTSTGAGLKDVVIDPNNTSLSGIRDAINKAGVGVTASIFNDGSSAPYRLILTDTSTGKANSMKISVSGDVALSQLLSHDPSATITSQAMSETQTAKDALFTIDGLSLSKPTNSVNDAITGVTLNLLKTSTTPVSLSMTSNASFISGAITKFVSAYNQVNATLKQSSVYNPTTKVAAILNGDPAIRGLQSQIRAVMTAPIKGGSNVTSLLFQVGVHMQKDGILSIDSTKLNTAIANDAASVTSLFSAVGSSTDNQVSFNSAGTNTKPGAYAINVSQLAKQAIFSSSAPSGLTVTAGSNDAMQVQLNGVTGNIQLDAGTYTAASLASAIQTKINSVPAFSAAGLSITASMTGANNDTLSLTSNNYGSSSSIGFTSVVGGNLSYFFGDTPSAAIGSDVSGAIDGISTLGSGQFMTGAPGSNANGLKLQILGGSAGNRGTVNYSQGYAYQLNDLLTKALATTGSIDSETSGLNSSITQLGKNRAALSTRLASIQARYQAQFTSLDLLLGKMTTTSSYLTQQLAVIAKN
jgi:flagellar hook-associated protein 2